MEKKGEVIHFRENFAYYFNALKPYKGLIVIVIAAVFISEAMAIIDKFALKYFVEYATDLSSGVVSAGVFVQFCVILSAALIAAMIIRAISKWVLFAYTNVLESHLIKDVKVYFYNHIIHLSYGFHSSHRTGSMISKLIKGGNSMETITDSFLFNFFPLIFQIFFVIASLVFLDLYSALVIFVLVIVYLSYSLYVQQKQQPASLDFNTFEDSEKGEVSDSFMNIDSIKFFGKESYIKSRFEQTASTTRKKWVRYVDYFTMLEVGHVIILGLGMMALFIVTAVQFMHGLISLSTVVFTIAVFSNIYSPLFSFVWGMRNLYRAMSDFESLMYYKKFTNEIVDRTDAKNISVGKGTILFDNLSFNYGRRHLFKNFSLSIPQNKRVALVGHSGSGKSTLVKLLFRFYDVNSGGIFVDGQDIREFKQESLRSELSIVPQDCILFDDTIYNNIAFANPAASRKEVLRAIELSQLSPVIAIMPKKENTIVGERGVKLSGGEKQRVSIARAILANKKILVLDEATSSLDSRTEHIIQKALASLLKGRTSIMIAHRLSTIMNADIIVVLSEGKIVQMGTHNQLIKQKGEYKKLWDLQKGGYLSS